MAKGWIFPGSSLNTVLTETIVSRDISLIGFLFLVCFQYRLSFEPGHLLLSEIYLVCYYPCNQQALQSNKGSDLSGDG